MKLNEEEKGKFGLVENEEKNKDDDVLKEPIPKTNFCHLCRRQFDNYLLHIETMIHKKNISKNQMMINTAKNTFQRINQFWNNKNNNLNNQINEKNEKMEINKLNSGSISSFSSAVSLFKYEENLLKDINSFILEQDNSDNDKNNDKENQSENIHKNTKNKQNIRKNHFVTPIKKEKLLINKFSSQLSSSQSSLNIFINKKRKEKNNMKNEDNNKYNVEEKKEKQIDYFENLKVDNNKKLISEINVFFE